MSVGFNGLGGLLYLLEFSPGLNPPAWQVIQSSTVGVSNRIDLGHTPGGSATTGVYRIRVESP